MSNVVHIRKFKRKRAEGKTMCTSGFHKWETIGERRFDVREGKLITAQRCQRCGEERTKLT